MLLEIPADSAIISAMHLKCPGDITFKSNQNKFTVKYSNDYIEVVSHSDTATRLKDRNPSRKKNI